jgi:hypothetical protein
MVLTCRVVTIVVLAAFVLLTSQTAQARELLQGAELAVHVKQSRRLASHGRNLFVSM